MVRIISWVMKYLFTLVQFIILACEYLLTQDTSYMCHGHRNPPHLNGSCYRLWRPLRGLHAAGHLKTPAITAAHSTGHMPSTEPEDITCQVFKQVSPWSPCTLCKQRKNQIHKTWIGALPLPTGTAVFTISVIKGRWHQEREAAITIQACPPPPTPPTSLPCSSILPSVTAAATAQWLEFNQPLPKRRSGPKQQWLSGEFVNEEHGPISNYQSKAG